MLHREHQIGSNFCYITWNKRLKQAYIFSKHFYSIALPPFWMTDKGSKWEYNALLNRWKAKPKPEQKAQINPGSASTSCNHRNKGNNDRSRFLEFVIKIKLGGGCWGGGGKKSWPVFAQTGAQTFTLAFRDFSRRSSAPDASTNFEPAREMLRVSQCHEESAAAARTPTPGTRSGSPLGLPGSPQTSLPPSSPPNPAEKAMTTSPPLAQNHPPRDLSGLRKSAHKDPKVHWKQKRHEHPRVVGGIPPPEGDARLPPRPRGCPIASGLPPSLRPSPRPRVPSPASPHQLPPRRRPTGAFPAAVTHCGRPFGPSAPSPAPPGPPCPASRALRAAAGTCRPATCTRRASWGRRRCWGGRRRRRRRGPPRTGRSGRSARWPCRSRSPSWAGARCAATRPWSGPSGWSGGPGAAPAAARTVAPPPARRLRRPCPTSPRRAPCGGTAAPPPRGSVPAAWTRRRPWPRCRQPPAEPAARSAPPPPRSAPGRPPPRRAAPLKGAGAAPPPPLPAPASLSGSGSGPAGRPAGPFPSAKGPVRHCHPRGRFGGSVPSGRAPPGRHHAPRRQLEDSPEGVFPPQPASSLEAAFPHPTALQLQEESSFRGKGQDHPTPRTRGFLAISEVHHVLCFPSHRCPSWNGPAGRPAQLASPPASPRKGKASLPQVPGVTLLLSCPHCPKDCPHSSRGAAGLNNPAWRFHPAGQCQGA